MRSKKNFENQSERKINFLKTELEERKLCKNIVRKRKCRKNGTRGKKFVEKQNLRKFGNRQ
jgi:hypothetical protein